MLQNKLHLKVFYFSVLERSNMVWQSALDHPRSSVVWGGKVAAAKMEEGGSTRFRQPGWRSAMDLARPERMDASGVISYQT